MAQMPGADVKHTPVLLVIMLVLAACARRDDPPTEGFLQLERNTEFDGANLWVFVTLDDGTVGSVNTTDDVLVPLPGVTPIPGHRAQAWTFLGPREPFGETGVSRPPPGVGG